MKRVGHEANERPMDAVFWLDYVIRPCSRELGGAGWVPHAILFALGDTSVIERHLAGREGMVLETREDADNYALGMAVRWINDNQGRSD